LRRLDAAARDLNRVLVVIAVGLAALDLTFAVSQKTLARLPVTRVVCDVKGEFHFVDVRIGARLRQAREREEGKERRRCGYSRREKAFARPRRRNPYDIPDPPVSSATLRSRNL
jgi:hypothetical protein